MGNVDSSVFIITEQTKAIIGLDSAYYRAHILEGHTERKSIHKPEQIIDNSCLLYGSTLKGRRAAAKEILRSNSKLPVPVIPSKGVYMLPTSSTKNKECVWLAYYHIDYYEQQDGKTVIVFNDGSWLNVNASRSTIDHQFKRTSQIIAKLNRSLFFGGKPGPFYGKGIYDW